LKIPVDSQKRGDEIDEPRSHPRPVAVTHGRRFRGELKIIAGILAPPVIEKILSHLGLDPQPPPKGRAREAGQDFVA
jgi:hypothetical protein